MTLGKPKIRRGIVLAGVVVAACCLATSASAQGVGTQYVPSRPTFSPYFGYFQINTSGLPNYYAFVRPQQQLEQLVQRQAHEARTARVQQQQQIARIQLRPTAPSEVLGIRRTGAVAPTPPATFMNYSHYYPAATVGPRPRR